MRKLFMVCAVFSALLVVVAGCGDDAKPTASAADNLDDRLFGIWTTQDEDRGEISFTFEEDGTLRTGVLGIEITGTWSTDGDKLTIMFPGGRYSYEITNGTLEFTTVTRGVSDLSFTTDGDATTLTGVTWVDEHGDELVFSADGTYRWGGDSFVFEEGTWAADGNTITTTVSPNSSPYSVSDDTMTFTDDEGEEQVLTRKYRGTPTAPPTVPSPDREILVALYNATDGPNWGSAGNWLTDAPLGSWSGVDVDALGRVTELRLVLNKLSGPIPPELGKLTNLTNLNLSFNELSGPIPLGVTSLTSLTDLDLFLNELSGPIPPELGNLTNLTDLWLSQNALSGPIPAELGNLTNLMDLDLSNNELTSPIPQSFLALDMLEVFDFEDNAGLCAPNTTEFVTWLQSIDKVSGPYCSASSSAPQ